GQSRAEARVREAARQVRRSDRERTRRNGFRRGGEPLRRALGHAHRAGVQPGRQASAELRSWTVDEQQRRLRRGQHGSALRDGRDRRRAYDAGRALPARFEGRPRTAADFGEVADEVAGAGPATFSSDPPAYSTAISEAPFPAPVTKTAGSIPVTSRYADATCSVN